jgi:hypothetical protein
MNKYKPSVVGEAAVVVAVIDLVLYVIKQSPSLLYISLIFVLIFLIDYMLGGITDKGLCKDCF